MNASQKPWMAGGETIRGRATEQRIIRDLLHGAQRGRGGVVLVDGEPGMGRSLLLRAATSLAAEYGFSLAVGPADQLSQASPFSALRMAMPDAFVAASAGSHDDVAE